MLKFGMPTLIETSSIDTCAALCKKLHLEFIELNMNLPQYQPGNINIPYFKEIADRYGIFYTVHLDENLNIGDFNPYVADAYRRTVAETIELSKKLSIPILNMHMSNGVYFTLPDKKIYLFSEYQEQYLESILRFRMMCEKAIGNSDITICIENCGGFFDFQRKAIDILLGSPVFGLTFDIGHNHSCGGLDEPYIIKNTTRLCHLHMHDALGKNNHLPLGTGEIHLNQYLNLAQEQNCRVVLETKTVEGLQQSVNWLQNRTKQREDIR